MLHDGSDAQSPADRNAELDKQIADVKVRTDINDKAKADIIGRINGMRKANATPLPVPGPKNGN